MVSVSIDYVMTVMSVRVMHVIASSAGRGLGLWSVSWSSRARLRVAQTAAGFLCMWSLALMSVVAMISRAHSPWHWLDTTQPWGVGFAWRPLVGCQQASESWERAPTPKMSDSVGARGVTNITVPYDLGIISYTSNRPPDCDGSYLAHNNRSFQKAGALIF